VKLIDLIHRNPSPVPWGEAENIPWNDPAFSERMLREHLSQRNDRASRRAARIALHVRWLDEELLASTPSKILDLACGPGLYTARLAELGHTCLGIDYAPAAIAHARQQARSFGDRCRYLEADIRQASYGDGHDLCTFVFGEFNSYPRRDAAAILRRAFDALAPGGRMVVEVHTEDAIERIAAAPSSWYTAERGLFSDDPHLVLVERFWDAAEKAATERFYAVDLETSVTQQISSTGRAYTETEYRSMFAEAGFRRVDFEAGMGDPDGAAADGLFAIVATR